MRTIVSLAGVLVLLLIVGGCAAKPPRAYIAATNETVRATTEESHGQAPAHNIYIENSSTVPVTVFSVTLRGCTNVKGTCDSPVSTNVRIPAGRRALVRRIEPRDPKQGFGYRYSYGWRADSGQSAALAVMANEGSVAAAEQLAAIERARAARQAEVGVHDEWLPVETVAALGSRAAGVRVEPDSFVVRVGEAVTLDRIRLMIIDSAGAPIGRARFSFGFQPGVVQFVRPDSLKAVAPGRVAIEVRLPVEANVGRTVMLPSRNVVIVVRP